MLQYKGKTFLQPITSREKDHTFMNQTQLGIKLQKQQQQIEHVFQRVFDHVPFYRHLYEKHGLHRDSLATCNTFQTIPFLVKQHFKETYPTGLVAVPKEQVVRYHASSGTSGLPTMVAYTQRDIDHWATMVADSLKRIGITHQSIIQNAFGYGMFTGGLGLHYGIEKIGATIVPSSTGNTEKQVLLMKDLQVDVITATPSYLLHIYDYLVKEQIPIESLSLKTAIVGAEPWTEEMRKEIEQKLNIKAYDIYGLSEAIGPGVAMECIHQNGLHIYEDGFYAEIIDPKTGEVLPIGEEGELVLTSLKKEASPIIRYRTGDITSLIETPCPCGNEFIRMKKPTGRVDDMLIIKGVNVFPSQIESVLLGSGMVNPHYQIIVQKLNNNDTLTIRVEVEETYRNETAIAKIKSKLYSVLGITFTIEFVKPFTLERSEGKAKRLFDLRKKGEIEMEKYKFQQLDTTYLEKAATCLGETFVGVQKGNYVIEEPMIKATELTVAQFTDICRLYLKSTLEQGYHFIAINRETDEVVGVLGTDVFDPDHVEAPYEGEYEVMNRAIESLETLDVLFLEKFESTIQRPIQKGDLLHGFLIGVQTPKNKRTIAKKLLELVLEKGKKEGMKGFFVEATNPRSQGLIKNEFSGYLPTDNTGKSISLSYKNDPFFHVIAPDVSEELQILYIPIDPSIDLI